MSAMVEPRADLNVRTVHTLTTYDLRQELNRRGEYRLAGRIDGADSHAGAPAELESIRFGVNQSEELPEHMKQPASSRWMEPCASEAYESLLFAHLRVPGPRTQAALRREDAARLYHQ